MMTTNYLILPALNNIAAKVPITSVGSKPTRFRATPRRSYTAYEKKLLFQLVRQFKNATDSKDPHNSNASAKFLPWHIIAEEFNSREGTTAASATQLSNLYRNVTRKTKNELMKNELMRNRMINSSGAVKTEVDDYLLDECEQSIKMMDDSSWPDKEDSSNKPPSSEDEGETVLGLEPDLFTNDSEKVNENVKSDGAGSSNLMKASSKAAEAFVELLNVAEPVSENNVIVLKQKEEEHRMRITHLVEEHNMKMLVLQAKLDYYRSLREKVMAFNKESKRET